MNLFKVRYMILIALLYSSCGSDQPDPETKTREAAPAEFSDSLVIELVGADSVSVLDLLLSAHQVDYRTTMSGVFVTAIDSVENGGECFWIYTVNGNQVSTASDDCFTSDGDRVKWHYRKF